MTSPSQRSHDTVTATNALDWARTAVAHGRYEAAISELDQAANALYDATEHDRVVRPCIGAVVASLAKRHIPAPVAARRSRGRITLWTNERSRAVMIRDVTQDVGGRRLEG
jgi:hypothetical protein